MNGRWWNRTTWRGGLALCAAVGCAVAASEPRTRILLKNTALLCAGTVAFSVPVGALLAILYGRVRLLGRALVGAILGGWLFLPLYLQAGAWRAGLGTLGWWPGAANWFEGLPGAIWCHAVAAVPVVFWMVSAGLRQVPAELEELGALEAAPWQVWRRVTLPLLTPSLLGSALVVIVWTAGEMTVTALFMVSTYTDELYTAISATGNVERAMIQILPGVLLVGTLVLLTAWLARSLASANVLQHWRARRLSETRRARRWSSAVVWGCLMVLVAWPVVNLGVQADPQWRQGWSGARACAGIGSSLARFVDELQWTGLISGTAATAAVLLAILCLWPTRERGTGWWQWSLVAVLWACPPTVLALLLLEARVAGDSVPWRWVCDRTIFLPALGQTLRALPIAMFVVDGALRAVPRPLWELLRLEGVPAWRQAAQVFLRVQWRAVATAWIAALAVACADLGGTLLLSPPGMTTLSMRIFERLHSGGDDQVAGISLWLVGAAILMAVAAQAMLRGRAATAPEDSAK